MKKRMLSLLLAVALLATLAVPLSGSQTLEADARTIEVLGDINENGKVDTTDARMILQICVGKYGPDGNWSVENLLPYEKQCVDVNRDDEINTTDARMTLQFAAEKITKFPNPDEYKGNSFSPNAAEAGTPFAALTALPENKPAEINDATKAFGYFALTTEKNPGLPFNVACHVTDTAITALVPSGVDLSAMLVSFTYYGDKVLLNNTAVTADTAFDFTAPVALTKVAKDGTLQGVTVTIEKLNTGLPSMAVTLENYTGAPSIEHDTYSKATFYLGGGDPAKCEYAASENQIMTGSIKGRGNSSWLLDEKKSYTVKLDQKAKLLDLDKSKNWAIVGNYEDKALMRNTMAEYFAEATEIGYVMEMRPVDMWFDGDYWGTYNIVEKIEIEGSRVDITDIEIPEGATVSTQKANEVGYLLEFDAHVMEANAGGQLENVQGRDPEKWASYGWSRYEYSYTDLYDSENPEKTGYVYYNPETDETFFRVPYCNGKWATIKKPSTKNLTDEMRKYIFQQVMTLDSALRNRNHDAAKIEELLDIESFAQWAIVQELMDNTDCSFHSSVYMSLDVGGKFVFGPVWDFDRSSGNCSYWKNNVGSLINNTNWGNYVFNTEAGKAVLKDVWATFKTNSADWETAFDSQYTMLGETAKVNFERWDILGKFVYYNSDETAAINTFKGQTNYLKEWLQARYAALDEFITNK